MGIYPLRAFTGNPERARRHLVVFGKRQAAQRSSTFSCHLSNLWRISTFGLWFVLGPKITAVLLTVWREWIFRPAVTR